MAQNAEGRRRNGPDWLSRSQWSYHQSVQRNGVGSALSQTTEARVVRGVRVSGRYYKCFWYAPEVKRWVKSTEENYSSNGSLSQAVTDELERFNVGGDGKPRGESADQRSIPSPGGDGI